MGWRAAPESTAKRTVEAGPGVGVAAAPGACAGTEDTAPPQPARSPRGRRTRRPADITPRLPAPLALRVALRGVAAGSRGGGVPPAGEGGEEGGAARVRWGSSHPCGTW